MLDLYYRLHDDDSQRAMLALAGGGNGARINQGNVASASDTRTCVLPRKSIGEGGFPIARFCKLNRMLI